MSKAIAAQNEREQQIVNMNGRAYDVESTSFEKGEMTIATRLCAEFGADIVFDWYKSAAEHGCPEYRASRYLCGCAKKQREGAA